jgi:hypothetical protein
MVMIPADAGSAAVKAATLTARTSAFIKASSPCPARIRQSVPEFSGESTKRRTSGSVRFEETPGGSTKVRVSLKYDPPGGKLGSLVARLFGENPEQQIDEDLARFKQIMETDAAYSSGRGATAGK